MSSILGKSAGDWKWFYGARFGMFIHWGLYSLPARHEWVRHNERIAAEAYEKYFEHFNPDCYDPQEWTRAAKKAGMKYVVITTKHHEGFCLWDSKYTEYKVTNTPYGKDILRPLVKAFRDEGLRIGFYYSLLDWHHPEFTVDWIHPQRDDEDFIAGQVHRKQDKYAQYMRDQVRELLTEFGKIDLLWFDFSYGEQENTARPGKGKDAWDSEKLVKMIREIQPQILINNRLDLPGSEDFITPEQYQPLAWPVDKNGHKQLWETCQTFSGSWGYHRDESSWKSSKQLLTLLVDSVSKGGNLLLNVGPTSRGKLDTRALKALDAISNWMSLHNRSIYQCTAAEDAVRAPEDCRFTYNPDLKRLYLHVMNWPCGAIHLQEMAGKVSYAQMLNDGSEVLLENTFDDMPHSNVRCPLPPRTLTLKLPVARPCEVPVIELFLNR